MQLPEPVVVPADGPGPAEHAELADSLSMAFLVLLEARLDLTSASPDHPHFPDEGARSSVGFHDLAAGRRSGGWVAVCQADGVRSEQIVAAVR